MEKQARRVDKERVRTLLIEPCEIKGLKKPSNMKVADYDTFRDTLCTALAYASDGTLQGLVEVAVLNAKGKDRDRWPALSWLIHQARVIEVPPPQESNLIRNLVKHHGLSALKKGSLVAMVQSSIKARSWPNDYAWSQIEKRAEYHRHNLVLLSEAIRDGRDKPELAAKVRWFSNRQDELIALLSDVTGETIPDLNKHKWVPDVQAAERARDDAPLNKTATTGGAAC